jgi:hypothetical protein
VAWYVDVFQKNAVGYQESSLKNKRKTDALVGMTSLQTLRALNTFGGFKVDHGLGFGHQDFAHAFGQIYALFHLGGTDLAPHTALFTLFARWAKAGLPTFALGQGLARALALTDASKLSLADVRWPFETFRIELPPDVIENVRAIYVSHTFYPDRLMTGSVGDFGTRMLNREFTEANSLECRPVLQVEVFDEAGNSKTTVLPVEDPRTVGEWASTSPMPAVLKQIFSMIYNVCAYLESLESPPRARSSSGKKRKGKRREQEVLSLVYDLDHATELGEVSVSELSAALGTGTERSIHARFVVRGHWRRQPCGPGRAERRWLWIQPHWKGPAHGVALARGYEAHS